MLLSALAASLLFAPPSTAGLEAELVKRHGEAQRARIERGVRQVAALWRKEDGDLSAFVREAFVADPVEMEGTFKRFEANFEVLDGHFLEMSRGLRWATDVDVGPLLPVDARFSSLDPSAHLTDDLFASKLAFVALLNFPQSALEERLRDGPTWSRRQWAEARLTERFARRVPASVQQAITRAESDADLYVSGYNLWMHHVLSEKGERLFPAGMRLISHWNLRDELKADYADPRGLEKQRTLVRLMERIVTQDIPALVIDNPRVDWNPFTNAVVVAPAAEVEPDAPARPTGTSSAGEPFTRYQKLLASFAARRQADPYSPTARTAVDRAFDLGAEIPEARVKALFEEVLSSPLVPQVAAEIERRLGRPLEPIDLWYDGFLPRGVVPQAELDTETRRRYPDAPAFARDIPRVLQALDFPKAKADFLAQHIRVDPSRGAGHAMEAMRRGDFPHLRTRVGAGGMDYKGYNIAVHELGHNVEQVISLYEVDSTLLAGVPNTAFTEAIAFVFQAKDLELLGHGKPDAEQERLRVLNDFWMTWEIAGVALVDVAVWRWMYEHPKATPKQLRDATVGIARDVWNRYYAKVLGGEGTPLLGIYSHMISYPLYLFNYPLGHLIAFQIEGQVKKAGKVGPELERMAKLGRLAPDEWMKQATGEPVSAAPLLRATEEALRR